MNDDNSFVPDINTARVHVNKDNEDSIFAANTLNKKTSDNLANSEKMIDEHPLWTEKTDELEKRAAIEEGK